jgi:UDP-N-acetyl-D-glucosamine dehydrogenase
MSAIRSAVEPTVQVLERLRDGTARIGVIGLGYVGLTLAAEFAGKFETFGFEVDIKRVAAISAGRSYIGDVDSTLLARLVTSGRFRASDDMTQLADCDCVIICVPTPLGQSRRPDLSYILAATRQICAQLHRGQLVVLESTTYPGTTDEVLLPSFEAIGLELDKDFLLAFSPERVDPGNKDYRIPDIPKIVGGCSPASTKAATALYATIVREVYPVSSARVAEATKLWENTFRAVNIAMANEMSLLCHKLGIDSNEIIDAAKTKPFGFIPFYPGPGIGGHCIPLDPHFLSSKAKEHGFHPRFIHVADEINSSMPGHVVDLIGTTLNEQGKPLREARVLVLGVSYKSDVDDVRESPALEVIKILRNKHAIVSYYDPHVPQLRLESIDPKTLRVAGPFARILRHDGIAKGTLEAAPDDVLESVELTDAELQGADCVVLLTAHTSFDYERMGSLASTIVDMRNVFRGKTQARIVRL